MTGPDSVLASDPENSDLNNVAADVTNSETTSLLTSTPSTPSTLSSRPRSYGAIATPDQPSRPSRATSAANPHLLDPHTVEAARANTTTSTARTTSVSGSKRQLIHASITSINASSDDITSADIDGSSSSSSAVSDSYSNSSDSISDADMPPQTAFLTSSQRRLAIAYCGLLLVAFTTSLEAQVTAPLAAFAVSSFSNHSLLSTVVVVQGVVNGELSFLSI